MSLEVNDDESDFKNESAKKRALKIVRNIIISVAVLFIVLIGGGTAYTWYMGQKPYDESTAIAQPVESKPAPRLTPTKPAADAKVGASVQELTSPITPGSNASMTVKTNAGSLCTIKVVYGTTASTDSGLSQKTADEYGIVNWTWTVESSAPVGKWPATVTCNYNKESAVVRGDLEIKSEI